MIDFSLEHAKLIRHFEGKGRCGTRIRFLSGNAGRSLLVRREGVQIDFARVKVTTYIKCGS